MANPVFVSTTKAAHMLGVTGKTVRKLIERGELVGVRVTDARILVPTADIDRHIQAKTVRPKPAAKS